MEKAFYSHRSQKIVKIETLIGKTITQIHGAYANSQQVVFICSDGTKYAMYHTQDCCENVALESIDSNPQILIDSPIELAEARSDSSDPTTPPGDCDGSFTWTFYTLATNRGHITFRWFGESNGYYSEDVDLYDVTNSTPDLEDPF